MISYRAPMSAWSPLAIATPLAGSALGTAAITLGSLSLASTGRVVDTGQLTQTLEALSLVSTGKSLANASAAITLGALTGTLTGTVTVGGTAAGTLQPLMLVGTGTVANEVFSGSLAATLGALTLAGTGTIANAAIRGSLTATLGSVSLVAFGNLILHARLGVTLGALTVSGSGNVTTAPLRTGTFNQALGPLTLKALGHVVIIPTSWPHEWCPAPGPTHAKTLAVETIELGDGYTYRLTRGLNPVGSTLTYAFPFEDAERLTDMDAFLRAHGSRGFLFLPPDEPLPVYVCCNAWSATLVDRTGSEFTGQLQSTFERRFNPMPGNPA